MRRERDDAEFMKIARQLMLDNIMVSTLAQRERKKERGREREKERGREGERERWLSQLSNHTEKTSKKHNATMW